jgi:hypothetical protein
MISSLISRTSATVLLVGGLVLLFASDVVLPALAPGFPRSATWIGSLLGSAWLAVAALNWSNRTVLLGGIYGRPIVYSNFILFVTSAFALVRVILRSGAPPALWFLAAPVMALAVAYAALLLRGPFDPLGDA